MKWDRSTQLVALKSPAGSFTMVQSFHNCTSDVGQTRKKVLEVTSVFSNGLGIMVDKRKLQFIEHILEIVFGTSVNLVEEHENFFVSLLTSSKKRISCIGILTQDEQKLLILLLCYKLSSKVLQN